MSEALYLDTARLGLMSPSAQRLQNSFARLAGDPHGLLYFREFLARGFEACPADWAERLPGLDAWRGLEGLGESIRRLTRASSDSDVLLASRSATLMELATHRLVGDCRRVLAVDLLWPPYRRILSKKCRQTGVAVVVCPLRTASLLDEERGQQLAARVGYAFEQNSCDGLVLPLIDHRGVTLPVGAILNRLRDRGRCPKYVIVDASQALGHVPIDLKSLGCDFLVGGAHKWLGGYHPLGIGVSARPSRHGTANLVDGDPLLQLTQEAIGTVAARHGETAAILPLLSAAGAIADLAFESVEQRLRVRRENRRRLRTLLDAAGWRPVRRQSERHGMLLARPPAGRIRNAFRPPIRSFAHHGISVTTYPNALVRFSLPSVTFSQRDANRLRAALNAENELRCDERSSVPLTTKATISCPTVESTTAQPAGSTKRTKAVSLATIPKESSVA